jgi:uncharacterized RDD family membrane protein YckC
VGVVLTEQPPLQPPTPPAGGYPPPPGEARRQWAEDHQAIGTLPKDAYTSWIRRVGAFLIDQLLFLIVALILAFVRFELVATTGGSSCRIDETTGRVSCSSWDWVRIVYVILGLAVLAFWFWNWGLRQGTTGSTIGKSVLKFKVVGERTGEPIGSGRSLLRYFAHFLDAIICYIGFLLPLFTAKRQTVADMVMETVCLPIEPWAQTQQPSQAYGAQPPYSTPSYETPPQQPPQPGQRSNRAPWIIAGAVAVLIVVAAVAAFVIPHFGLFGSMTPADKRLLGRLPTGYSSSNCTPHNDNSWGAIAGLYCSGNEEPAAPTEVRFWLFGDDESLTRGFNDIAGFQGVSSCSDQTKTWSHGQVECSTTHLVWTNQDGKFVGDADGSNLYNWFQQNVGGN